MNHSPMPPHSPHPAQSPAACPAVAPDSSADQNSAVNPLGIRVAAGESGPVVMLSGEADVTTLAQLENALNAQITAGAHILTVDLAGLRFADSATIGALARAARTLKAQGGRMELTNPQPILSRTLALLGVDRLLTVRGGETGEAP